MTITTFMWAAGVVGAILGGLIYGAYRVMGFYTDMRTADKGKIDQLLKDERQAAEELISRYRQLYEQEKAFRINEVGELERQVVTLRDEVARLTSQLTILENELRASRIEMQGVMSLNLEYQRKLMANTPGV